MTSCTFEQASAEAQAVNGISLGGIGKRPLSCGPRAKSCKKSTRARAQNQAGTGTAAGRAGPDREDRTTTGNVH